MKNHKAEKKLISRNKNLKKVESLLLTKEMTRFKAVNADTRNLKSTGNCDADLSCTLALIESTSQIHKML